MSPLHRLRRHQRLLLGGVGPAGDRRRHVGARGARAVHAVGAEGAEERAVEQRAEAQVQHAAGAGGERGQRPDADVLGLGDAAVLLVAAEHLRLHPERAALALGVPERLAARGGAGDVAAVEVAPGLAALARLDPGVAEDLDLGGGEPVVAALRRHVGDGAGDAVGGDQVLRVDGADGVDAPLHLAVVVLALEGEPVEALGVGADLDRRLDVVPLGVAVAVPGLGERVEVAVLRLQPVAEGGLGVGVVVDVGRVVGLVPDVVAEHARVVAVAGGERGQEGAGGLLDLGAVHRERAGAAAVVGEAAGRRGDAHDRGQRRAVARGACGRGRTCASPSRGRCG